MKSHQRLLHQASQFVVVRVVESKKATPSQGCSDILERAIYWCRNDVLQLRLHSTQLLFVLHVRVSVCLYTFLPDLQFNCIHWKLTDGAQYSEQHVSEQGKHARLSIDISLLCVSFCLGSQRGSNILTNQFLHDVLRAYLLHAQPPIIYLVQKY